MPFLRLERKTKLLGLRQFLEVLNLGPKFA